MHQNSVSKQVERAWRAAVLVSFMLPVLNATRAYPFFDDYTQCTNSEDCTDDVFCNGAENCEEGRCVAGPEPCEDGQECNEESNLCTGTGPSPGQTLESDTSSNPQCEQVAANDSLSGTTGDSVE